MPSFVTKLKCSRCGATYPPDAGVCMCETGDMGRLDIFYDYDSIAKKVTKKELRRRQPGVWKYRELLPVRREEAIVTLAEGGTPLLNAQRLARELGLRELLLKDETRNPTGSFKDRSMTVGISKAVELAVEAVVIASSGNAAASLAAYSAKAGLRCYAFVLEQAPLAKVAQIALYGATVLRVKMVEEGVDPTVDLMLKVVRKYGWYPCPSFGPFNPYQLEGPKTISYEIVEQLGWEVPDWVLIPTGSGCLLTGIWKGFRDFQRLGFIDSLPKLVAVQSEGCAPLVRAFKEGKEPHEIEPWSKPNTIAGGLSDVYPWDGDAALTAIRETEGTAEAVSDEEILQAQTILASSEGIFAEPSGVAALAGLVRLVERGLVAPDERVVVLITGTGLKDPTVVAETLGSVPLIAPSLEDFERHLRAASRMNDGS